MVSGYEKAALLLTVTVISFIFAWLAFQIKSSNPGMKILSMTLSFVFIMATFNLAYVFTVNDYPGVANIFMVFDVILFLMFGVFLTFVIVGTFYNYYLKKPTSTEA